MIILLVPTIMGCSIVVKQENLAKISCVRDKFFATSCVEKAHTYLGLFKSISKEKFMKWIFHISFHRHIRIVFVLVEILLLCEWKMNPL